MELPEMSYAETIPAAVPVPSQPLIPVPGEAAKIPWTIWLAVAGISLEMIGIIWDASWHDSIGVDTSWMPPHILIQVAAVPPLIACAYTILAATFARRSSARDVSVRVLGFHAPAGVFITVWGCVAVLVAQVFDNWWHQAYGDATIATPPHLLLLFGLVATQIGGMTWVASIMNRSTAEVRGRWIWLFLFVCALGFGNLASILPDNRSMHRADCYLMFALVIPSWLVAGGWGSTHKWGTTIIAALNTLISLGAQWLLPLFPAQARFGPVYHNTTHLIPPGFPALLIVPAFVADFLLLRLGQRPSWIKAVWVGPSLALSFLAVQWPFANFLMLPAARNWIFGTAYFGYGDPAGVLFDPYKFETTEKLGVFLLTMAASLVASVLATRLGLAWGDWMRRVRR
jgi:hypothetical protein